ncbi:hypothetical protein LZ554_009180 [Drepanopeziza brunnea f. sp. 'monogermtubi']|nr:hypothetical protein LZ554_009180 [Drepanopeziza brunnea f. sp. 'monogermtubi']
MVLSSTIPAAVSVSQCLHDKTDLGHFGQLHQFNPYRDRPAASSGQWQCDAPASPRRGEPGRGSTLLHGVDARRRDDEDPEDSGWRLGHLGLLLAPALLGLINRHPIFVILAGHPLQACHQDQEAINSKTRTLKIDDDPLCSTRAGMHFFTCCPRLCDYEIYRG